MMGFVLGSQSSWERDSSYLFLFSDFSFFKTSHCPVFNCCRYPPTPLFPVRFLCRSAQQYGTHAVGDNRVVKLDTEMLCVVFCRINWERKEKKREAGMRWSEVWNNNKKNTLSTLNAGVWSSSVAILTKALLEWLILAFVLFYKHINK